MGISTFLRRSYNITIIAGTAVLTLYPKENEYMKVVISTASLFYLYGNTYKSRNMSQTAGHLSFVKENEK